MVLDLDKEVFVVHIATITSEMAIYSVHKAQIALLKAKEALVTLPAKYSDFVDVFSKKLAAVLLEHTKINIYAIDLKEDK